VVVVDVTTLNFNVLFELGFALGLNLPILLVRDTSYVRDKRDFEELGLLDTIGYIDFQNAEALVDRLRSALPPAPLPEPAVSLNRDAPIYSIKSHLATEGEVRLMSALKKSSLRFRSYDPLEDPRLTLHEARRQVAASLGVLGYLLDPQRKGATVHNARTAFIAGIATATGKAVLLLQETDHRAPIDYRDIVKAYPSPDLIPQRLEPFFREIIRRLQDTGLAGNRPPSQPLERLDLGDLAAENEIRQLRSYFVRTAQYQEARRGHARLIIGRKGAGKTAIFYGVRDSVPHTPGHLILDMKPEGHQFATLREAVLNSLSPGLQEHTLTAFWNYLVLCEIAQKSLQRDPTWATRDPRRLARFNRLAAVYADQAPDDTGDFSERLLQLVKRLKGRLARTAVPTTASDITQALFLGEIPALETAVLDYVNEKQEVWLLFDNLDKGWPTRGATREDILILRTLLEATRKLQHKFDREDVSVNVLVFLRNDIYEELLRDTPDRDKDTAVSLDWNDPEVFKEMVRQRLQAAVGATGTFSELWSEFFESYVGTRESFAYVVDHTLMRPRDVLRFLRRAIETAVNRGHRRVTEEDFRQAERGYSDDMVVAVNFEVADVNPEFQDLPFHFIGAPSAMTAASFRDRLLEAGVRNEFVDDATELLIWFGFVGVRAPGQDEAHFSHQVRYNLSKINVLLATPGAEVVVHPAFRSALGCL
jgi:hypothetical protein